VSPDEWKGKRAKQGSDNAGKLKPVVGTREPLRMRPVSWNATGAPTRFQVIQMPDYLKRTPGADRTTRRSKGKRNDENCPPGLL